jgi:hypothetical protein
LAAGAAMRFTVDRVLGPRGASRHALVARARLLEYIQIFAASTNRH